MINKPDSTGYAANANLNNLSKYFFWISVEQMQIQTDYQVMVI